MVNKASKKIEIVHLYAKEMNTYGDRGNILALVYRLKRYGVEVAVTTCGIGDKIPNNADIIVAGGGQDHNQLQIQSDLMTKSFSLKSMFSEGVSCLAVCGMYQLLGHKFDTADMGAIEGMGYLNIETTAGSERLTGNILIQTDFGEVVGFENHSGNTRLLGDQEALGKVIFGHGNNNEAKFEGACLNNVYGTYLHGPVLPKNPNFTDTIIRGAFDRKYGSSDIMSEQLDDSLELLAFQTARILK